MMETEKEETEGSDHMDGLLTDDEDDDGEGSDKEMGDDAEEGDEADSIKLQKLAAQVILSWYLLTILVSCINGFVLNLIIQTLNSWNKFFLT